MSEHALVDLLPGRSSDGGKVDGVWDEGREPACTGARQWRALVSAPREPNDHKAICYSSGVHPRQGVQFIFGQWPGAD